MPTKRLSPSSDLGDVAELPLKKTHRTHEENQERAYIAASRRADRDIEHRIRSAMKASECRRKRTGRGLKITRQAVMGDEQYESEEDDHATRRFSMSTTSSTLSDSYMPSREDRYAEVDALFKKHFPNVQLSSRHNAAPQIHRHSYPQQLQPHPGFVARYSQDLSAQAAQGSPMLTPPTSYPLQPVKTEKSGSMSPLILESRSRRGSAPAQQATVDLGITLGDPSAGTGYLLDDSVDAQGEYLYGASRTASAPSTSFLPVDFSALATGSPSWLSSEGLPPTTGAAWHGRNLSISSALQQFEFPVETTSATTTALPAVAPESQTLVDPAILPSAGLVHASTEASRAVTATPPNEPWADWVNLDGDGLQPLGVKV
ncbi:hypothetical protein N657DRAFT_571628 [Parathielavia appendiculata]|uniref:Uncharacterized protein n=1 Tax=Parathielavia appendiculata TaxID=2587402 RepID=A0AAN6U1D6_9PEZI|nr:hypothetical protein N657DRAFT_571628 [Parathielavia appendiculata]